VVRIPIRLLSFEDLKPAAEEAWVEFADDRRKLLLYGGDVTDPLGTLAARVGISSSSFRRPARSRTPPSWRTARPGSPSWPPAESTRFRRPPREVVLSGCCVRRRPRDRRDERPWHRSPAPLLRRCPPLFREPRSRLPRLPPAGVEASGFAGRRRWIAYADAMTSAPEPQLRATPMNALAMAPSLVHGRTPTRLARRCPPRAELLAKALDQAPPSATAPHWRWGQCPARSP